MTSQAQSRLSNERLYELGFAQTFPKDSSGISIIIVGCGFAGLACAIESFRKGHSVVILEKDPEHRQLGDIIALGLNVGHSIDRWGLHDILWPVCGHAEYVHFHNHKGELVQKQDFSQALYGTHAYNGHRAEMHQILVDYAIGLGIEIRMGEEITEFFEDVERGKAGVVSNEVRIEADVVVGADGVRSKGRTLVLGHEDKAMSSGYAIYRTWFNAKEAGIDKDPLTHFLATDEDLLYGWLGPDVHLLVANTRRGETVTCVLTHKDNADVITRTQFEGNKDDVLEIVKDWDPRCNAILSKAPSFVDWKILYRDPLPTWVSPGARMVLIGDAAHTFLPTSIQGGSQAMEDGVALASVLQIAGRDNIPLALQTWEHLRYQRVRHAQLLGFDTRTRWHNLTPESRGDELNAPRPEWLVNFDAERDTYERWAKVSEKIKTEGYMLPELPA